jgi:site-specific recombinase XerD
MTALRRRLIEDMTVRNLAPTTQATYVYQVSMFARHFGRSPETLGPEQIRSYLVYLAMEKKLAPSSISTAVGALRFLYNVTLQKHWVLEDFIPTPKIPDTLPVILSPEEVLQFLESVEDLQHRTILTACYAAGLRISEAVHLKPVDIDSQRMVIRIEKGKGAKDRYVMLSPRLLETLRHWWRSERPQHWLFPGMRADKPLTRQAVEKACQEAYSHCGIAKPITPHSFRHAFAVHMLENGTDVRTIQLLMGHSCLSTTAIYLRIATTKVCSATSPLDLLPRPVDAKAFLPPEHS